MMIKDSEMATLKFAGVFAGALVMLVSAIPVTAAPASDEPMKVRVEYNDLDLSTAHDQARLQKRLRYAVKTVCGPDNPHIFADSQASMQCQITAMAKAKQEAGIAIARYDNAEKLASNR
jgi:UrcA family protein